MGAYKKNYNRETILLSKLQETLLDKIGTSIAATKQRTFYFIPYWFTRNRDNHTVTFYSLGKLPEELMELIREMRDLPVDKNGRDL